MMHVLRERERAPVATVRALAIVQAQVGFQIAGGREALVANLRRAGSGRETKMGAKTKQKVGTGPSFYFSHLTAMRLLPGVHQVVFLQMSQLRETEEGKAISEWIGGFWVEQQCLNNKLNIHWFQNVLISQK